MCVVKLQSIKSNSTIQLHTQHAVSKLEVSVFIVSFQFDKRKAFLFQEVYHLAKHHHQPFLMVVLNIYKEQSMQHHHYYLLKSYFTKLLKKKSTWCNTNGVGKKLQQQKPKKNQPSSFQTLWKKWPTSYVQDNLLPVAKTKYQR